MRISIFLPSVIVLALMKAVVATPKNNFYLNATNAKYYELESKTAYLKDTIGRLKISIDLVSNELRMIEKRHDCTSCIRAWNQDEAKQNRVTDSWSRLGLRAQPSRDINDGDSLRKRWPRSPMNNGPLPVPRRTQTNRAASEKANNVADRQICLDGLPGLDGAPGLDGVPGADGRNGRDGRDGKEGTNGLDGKDGLAGERGPMGPAGPAGPAGEPGRRGRAGPAGKMGPPGQPGVCVYQARYNCASLPPSSNQSSQTGGQQPKRPQLLMAPTMVGGSGVDGDTGGLNGERQVSVNEGDNIQLSCEAHGLPRPSYIWRRSDRQAVILLDAQTNLKVSSYAGGQLPLARVDRLQAGSYECLASNGIPPSVSKRISLDINYKPTVRLYPTARQQPDVSYPTTTTTIGDNNKLIISLGSSVLLECLVEANPSALAYWMFENELIMSIGSDTSSQSQSSSSSLAMSNGQTSTNELTRHDKRFMITESTGQLKTGGSYLILTLNISQLERHDIGQYKCVGKNLHGQTVGSLELVDSANETQIISETTPRNDNLVQLRQLDQFSGWPNYLYERTTTTLLPTLYATFGNEHRSFQWPGESVRNLSTESMVELFKRITNVLHDENVVTNGSEGATSDLSESLTPFDFVTSQMELNGNSSIKLSNSSIDQLDIVTTTSGSNYINGPGAEIIGEPPNGPSNSEDDLELCRRLGKQVTRLPAIGSQLLDQIGKPVFVGNGGPPISINWWSVDTALRRVSPGEQTGGISGHETHFVTLAGKPNELVEYETQAHLQRDLLSAKSGIDIPGKRIYKLPVPIYLPGVQLIYKNNFFYFAHVLAHNNNQETVTTSASANYQLDRGTPTPETTRTGTLADLTLIVFNLEHNKIVVNQNNLNNLKFINGQHGPPSARPLEVTDEWWRWWARQSLDLGPDYKLNRLELMADESGVWLIVPTLEFVMARRPQDIITGANASLSGHRVASNGDKKSGTIEGHSSRLVAGRQGGQEDKEREKEKEKERVREEREEEERETVEKVGERDGGRHIASLQGSFNTRRNLVRRLHVLKMSDTGLLAGDNGATYEQANQTQIHPSMSNLHVTMKLDWRMIGQMFIVDGILYGIKDRHSYVSKLQFAYDLYRCKLLSGDYLTSHTASDGPQRRVFTNHFGDTQMIRYIPNEPKRLYTIDSGNLLWRPLKLAQSVHPDESLN